MKLRNKKTGEIEDLSIFGITLNIRKEQQPTYHSIGELCKDWEDVKEPLIKDQKVRKAVRAWAEAIELNPKDIILYIYSDGSAIELPTDSVIDFGDKIVDPSKIEDGRHYSIEELCGSEEIEILEPTYTTIEEKERLREQE